MEGQTTKTRTLVLQASVAIVRYGGLLLLVKVEGVKHQKVVADDTKEFGYEDEAISCASDPSPSLDNRAEVEHGQNEEQSFVEEDSAQSQSLGPEGDTSQPMEFAVPLVRPPEPQSEAWLARLAVTHSGNTPYIPSSSDEENGGDGGVAGRPCFYGTREPDGEDGQPDSFTSTEDSFAEENSRSDDEGNRTVDVTQLIRRISLAPSTGNSTMEVTSVYGEQGEESASKIPSPTPPTNSLEVPRQTHANAAKPSSPIPAGTESAPVEPQSIAAAPQAFSFIPRPRTPATTGRPPSPSKAKIPDGQSSPAKKPSGPHKLTAGLTRHDLPQPSNLFSKPSPRKPSQAQVKQGTESEAGPGKRASLGLRRPFGYLARSEELRAMGTRKKSISVARDVEGVPLQFEVSAEKVNARGDRIARDPSAAEDTVGPAEHTEPQATTSLEPQKMSVVSESSHNDLASEPSTLLSSQQVLVDDSMPDMAEDLGGDADDEVPQNSLPVLPISSKVTGNGLIRMILTASS
ncbi:hypothetical protein EDD15DRAFT_2367766 [Pisolithus albus]|nr:hypothetical protein EDD15DRAFT_2367766 [Pisolithus albus]